MENAPNRRYIHIFQSNFLYIEIFQKFYQAENHADVFFSVAQLPRINGEGTQTVIAVGAFYAQRLELVWTEDPNVSRNLTIVQ